MGRSKYGVVWLPFLLIVLFPLQGCSLPYLFHVAAGQMRLIEKRKDVSEILNDPEFSEKKKDKLRFISEVRNFAIQKLHLTAHDNYTQYVELDRDSVAYNLVVCPKDTLTPKGFWFPFVGDIHYLGFFNTPYALEMKSEFDEEGYDTHLRGVSAYSTLGWFSDPIFSSMMGYPENVLANLIIHELTHGTIYKKGDTEFNEGVSTFVGNQGSIQFLIQKFGEGSTLHVAAQRDQADDIVFSNFIQNAKRKLTQFYEKQLSSEERIVGRERIFEQIKKDFLDIKKKFKTTNYDFFEKMNLNNAVIVGFGQYYGGLDIFEKVWILQRRDFQKTLQIFKEAAEAQDSFEYLKKKTL